MVRGGSIGRRRGFIGYKDRNGAFTISVNKV